MNNYSLTVFLLPDSKARMIKCVYNPHEGNEDSKDRYNFKTFDQEIKKGDYCVVPTEGHGARLEMTIVKCVEADVEPDFDAPHQFKWIVARVDPSDYERTLKIEEELIKKHRDLDKRKRRAELAKQFADDAEDQDIGLVTFNGDTPADSDEVLAKENPDDEMPF